MCSVALAAVVAAVAVLGCLGSPAPALTREALGVGCLKGVVAGCRFLRPLQSKAGKFTRPRTSLFAELRAVFGSGTPLSFGKVSRLTCG